MDLKERLCSEAWTKSPLGDKSSKTLTSDPQPFTAFSLQQQHRKWNDPSSLDYGIGLQQPFSKFDLPSEPSSSNPANQIKIPDQVNGQTTEMAIDANKLQGWDPRAMLTNLSFLEQKIHQLQDLVHLIVGRGGQALARPDEIVAQQKQLVTADLTSIIVQLISTAGSLLPSVKNNILAANPFLGQLGSNSGIGLPRTLGMNDDAMPQSNGGTKVFDHSEQTESMGNESPEQNHAGQSHHTVSPIEELDSKDDEDGGEGENLPPGSYEVLQLEKEEILAPHTHFCMICGKGFKRDANLRMHMRGHGDEYKTAAALAKPNKELSSEATLIRRYSCPFAGCKRNKDHKKFQPLKTILCVKNHYKRTHCDKSYTCSRCNSKKFSVIADLKTHEKHCGRDKWVCSCGTTFSRKDKLFGHVALFQGHTPVLPFDENKVTSGLVEQGESNETTTETHGEGNTGFSFSSSASSGSGTHNVVDVKNSIHDPTGYFSSMNFDTCNFGGFHEFPRPPFDVPDNSFSFLLSGACNYIQKSEGASGSDALN
ncbi:protein SENSITIVE TO PROTON RHIZOTOXICITY 1-like [Macadamia integrifolia]|uniref:protein SENSITIVE TO PROTON RHIZOTOXICITY 1-like n=1 Tax=Macadamia integrifolia TaxID=60698 RepID=UPI001C4E8D22|nr:protein SENSITIVE TO PROTON RHIZOTOXICITY 1-like [Macadamia integrifolia]